VTFANNPSIIEAQERRRTQSHFIENARINVSQAQMRITEASKAGDWSTAQHAARDLLEAQCLLDAAPQTDDSEFYSAVRNAVRDLLSTSSASINRKKAPYSPQSVESAKAKVTAESDNLRLLAQLWGQTPDDSRLTDRLFRSAENLERNLAEYAELMATAQSVFDADEIERVKFNPPSLPGRKYLRAPRQPNYQS
jgi:hypothetical protein